MRWILFLLGANCDLSCLLVFLTKPTHRPGVRHYCNVVLCSFMCKGQMTEGNKVVDEIADMCQRPGNPRAVGGLHTKRAKTTAFLP